MLSGAGSEEACSDSCVAVYQLVFRCQWINFLAAFLFREAGFRCTQNLP